jgi:hypothetical protein
MQRPACDEIKPEAKGREGCLSTLVDKVEEGWKEGIDEPIPLSHMQLVSSSLEIVDNLLFLLGSTGISKRSLLVLFFCHRWVVRFGRLDSID